MNAMAASESAPRLLDGVRDDRRPASLADHRRRHGDLDFDARTILDVIERSGLRGCGGGGFPTARKLQAVRASGGRAIVVANGVEGEPVSAKDKTLLAYVPHLVLDGAVVAARAVRAREAFVAVTQPLLGVVENAIAERNDGRIQLQAVAVPETFVSGEETALIHYLNGGPALPTLTPPRPFQRGVRGLPTLVQNVETLARLALVARHGSSPDTTLFTVSGAVRRPGVCEQPAGSALAKLLADAGGIRGRASAFLVGGYFGTWLPAAVLDDLSLTDAALEPYGATLGARAIAVLPEGACGVRETARIARYLADESAGQCGPCVHGLAAVASDLEALVARGRTVDRGRLEQRLRVIARRGACRHPDGAIHLVESALRVFASDVEQHLAGRRCEAKG